MASTIDNPKMLASSPTGFFSWLGCIFGGGTWDPEIGCILYDRSWWGDFIDSIGTTINNIGINFFGGGGDDSGAGTSTDGTGAATYTNANGSTVAVNINNVTSGGMAYITVNTPCTPGGPSDGSGDQTTQDTFNNDPDPCSGGGSVSQWVPITSTNLVTTSITNNAYTKCVYDNLKNNTVYQALINGFMSNNTYNLVLKVGSVEGYNDANGITVRTSNSNDVVTTFNQNKVSTLSIGELAATFLHEAYHAYIDLILMQNTPAGQAALNSTYPDSFDQLVAYRVATTKASYIAQGLPVNDQQIQHDVIAQDIAKLGGALQQFIETVYPAVKNDPYYTPTVYQNMIWKGLTDSQAIITTFGPKSTWLSNGLPADVNTAFGFIQQIPSPCN